MRNADPMVIEQAEIQADAFWSRSIAAGRGHERADLEKETIATFYAIERRKAKASGASNPEQREALVATELRRIFQESLNP